MAVESSVTPALYHLLTHNSALEIIKVSLTCNDVEIQRNTQC